MALKQVPEPQITVNGHELTEGQAMTLRVAMEEFAVILSDKKFAKQLGMVGDNYFDRIEEIRNYMGYGRRVT